MENYRPEKKETRIKNVMYVLLYMLLQQFVSVEISIATLLLETCDVLPHDLMEILLSAHMLVVFVLVITRMRGISSRRIGIFKQYIVSIMNHLTLGRIILNCYPRSE